MYYKKLSNLLRILSPLELDRGQKRRLIKETHNCIGRMYGLPTVLNKSIEEAKEKNLIQDEAYEYLDKSINKYYEEIISGINSGESHSAYTNNIV